MIEFRVAFWEDTGRTSGMTTVHAVFNGAKVEVAVRAVATVSPSQWDSLRAAISAQAHDRWSSIYAGTPLQADLQQGTMSAEAMMAVGALHLLAPTVAGAELLEQGVTPLTPTYSRQILKDGLGNDLRVLGPIAPSDLQAATELMRFGLLQKLFIQVAGVPRAAATYEVYFAPFHSPLVATSLLSSAAIALKGRLP